MPWIRKDNSLIEVDTTRASDQTFCALRKKHGFVLGVENDAAVSFLHDFKELLNKHVINGELNTTSSDGLQKHCMRVIDDVLSILTANLGHEQAHIHLEITPIISVNTSQGDEHPFIQALTRSLGHRVNEPIRDPKSQI